MAFYQRTKYTVVTLPRWLVSTPIQLSCPPDQTLVSQEDGAFAHAQGVWHRCMPPPEAHLKGQETAAGVDGRQEELPVGKKKTNCHAAANPAPILHKIECNEFVCNKFVSNLVQIDLMQFKYSNCIRSICTKTNTNSLRTNSLHSILRKIGQMIQIVMHQFVHKTSAKKIP
jgi:hypothetical protein